MKLYHDPEQGGMTVADAMANRAQAILDEACAGYGHSSQWNEVLVNPDDPSQPVSRMRVCRRCHRELEITTPVFDGGIPSVQRGELGAQEGV